MDTTAYLLAASGPAVALANLVYMVVSQRKKASTEQLDAIKTELAGKADATAVRAVDVRVAQAETRLTRVEGEIDNLPDKDSAHRLELSLSEVKGELKVLAQRLEPVAATSNRLQEFLLEQANGR